MKLEQSFEVAAPVERVWQALIDVEQVAPCLPGAAITGRNDDGSYGGSFSVKIGPTTASYTGKLQMESIDEDSHTATMQAQGSDKRGQGGATATIASRLEAAGEGRTRVWVDTDYHITGRLARFGRGGMIEDISERLLKEFAKRLAESLEGAGGAAPAEAAPAASASNTATPPVEAAPPPTEAVAPPPSDTRAPVPEEESAPATPDPAPPSEDAPAPASSEAPPPPQDAPPPPAPEPPPPPEPPAPPEPPPPPEPPAPPEPPPPPKPPPPPEAPPPPPPPPDAPPPPPPSPPPIAEAPPPLSPPPANEPLDAGSLVGSVLVDRIRANPWPWIGGAFVIWRLLRRLRR